MYVGLSSARCERRMFRRERVFFFFGTAIVAFSTAPSSGDHLGGL